MARNLGVNLIEAVTDGWYSRADLTRLVESCATCGLKKDCAPWEGITPLGESLPRHCRNKADIEVLSSWLFDPGL